MASAFVDFGTDLGVLVTGVARAVVRTVVVCAIGMFGASRRFVAFVNICACPAVAVETVLAVTREVAIRVLADTIGVTIVLEGASFLTLVHIATLTTISRKSAVARTREVTDGVGAGRLSVALVTVLGVDGLGAFVNVGAHDAIATETLLADAFLVLLAVARAGAQAHRLTFAPRVGVSFVIFRTLALVAPR